MELSEKVETALVTYIRQKVQDALDDLTLPAYFDPTTQVQPGESEEDITQQMVRCAVGSADQEMPQYTGNFFLPITVEVLTPAAEQTETEAGSADPAEATSQIDKHKALAGIVETAIMVDDLPAQLTAAVADFTCIQVLDRLPQRSQGDNVYVSGITFRCYAAGSDLS